VASRQLGSHKPRRALADTDAFLEDTALPRRGRPAGRLVRGSIALGAAGTVGVLALVAPGIALNASAAGAAAPSQQRVGTTDAFTVRGTSTDRDADRAAATEEVSTAADTRAEALDAVVDQVEATQQSVAVAARAESLASTSTQIDSEAERLHSLGQFFWPTPGGITSEWGMRLHPILKYVRMHAGADIGGACGAPIWAAQDGVVVSTRSEGQGGQVVRVDHGTINGKEMLTAYMHVSAFEVSPGEEVSKGQLIARVGNTGLSTACPLHISVYANGANVNPRGYITHG